MRRSIIPPKTMMDVLRKRQRADCGSSSIGELADRLNMLQSELANRLEKAKIDTGFNIGGFGIGNVGSVRGGGSQHGNSPIRVYKPQKKREAAPVKYEPKIEYTFDIIPDYDGKAGLGVVLECKGISFSDGAFDKSGDGSGKGASVCYTPVRYNDRNVFLILSTIDDILELEVVPQRTGVEQIFSNEIYIPELAGYGPSSMEAMKRNGLILICYKKMS